MSGPPPGDGGEPPYDGPPSWGPPVDGEPIYPQYPGPPYGQPPYGGQPYGAQPYGAQPYGADPPYATTAPGPRRGNLVAVLVAAAVVAVAVVVAVIVLLGSGSSSDEGSTVQVPTGPTGFPSAAPSPGSSGAPTAVPTGPGINAISATLTGVRFFTALTTHDLGGATALACPGVRLGLTQAKLDRLSAALPDGPATTSGPAATMQGTLARTDGSRGELSVHLRNSGSDWCVDRASGL